MRALLDVNVLVALFDPDHIFHERAHRWLEGIGAQGIASCPLTENGVVRILCNPAYSKTLRVSLPDMMGRLALFFEGYDHQFWTDDFSICAETIVNRNHLLGHRQLTDAYLLGLAVRNGGRLITFDEGVSLKAIRGASEKHRILL